MKERYYTLAFLIGLQLLTFSCKKETDHKEKEPKEIVIKQHSDYYTEPYRPQFHFTPEANWMNDPNGMFYLDGVYHLFYQYYPDGTKWGPMHWGHATSPDMIHWEHQPIALYPDELGYIFSGSAVVDKDNTAGFGKNAVIAIFTYHDTKKVEEGKGDHQSQGIAYSTDGGKSFTKYEQNPVLPNSENIWDFRDPKVSWHNATKKWIMTLAVKDHIEFYSSPDLKEWQKESEFGKGKGSQEGVWECPDLIQMDDKWVLLVSVGEGGPNGGSSTQYFVGDFDGHTFTPLDDKIRWIDWGTDNYAGVTWYNAPDNRILFMGWMSNWRYGQEVPTEKWRSAMTLPRELKLIQEGENYTIQVQPVKEWENIVREGETHQISSNDTKELETGWNQHELIWRNLPKQGVSTMTFSNAMNEKVVLRIDYDQQQFVLDRSSSGKPKEVPSEQEEGKESVEKVYNDSFFKEQIIPLDEIGAVEKVEVIVDASSFEVFINDGKKVLTALYFPTQDFTQLNIKSTEEQETTLQVNRIQRIWK